MRNCGAALEAVEGGFEGGLGGGGSKLKKEVVSDVKKKTVRKYCHILSYGIPIIPTMYGPEENTRGVFCQSSL